MSTTKHVLILWRKCCRCVPRWFGTVFTFFDRLLNAFGFIRSSRAKERVWFRSVKTVAMYFLGSSQDIAVKASSDWYEEINGWLCDYLMTACAAGCKCTTYFCQIRAATVLNLCITNNQQTLSNSAALLLVSLYIPFRPAWVKPSRNEGNAWGCGWMMKAVAVLMDDVLMASSHTKPLGFKQNSNYITILTLQLHPSSFESLSHSLSLIPTHTSSICVTSVVIKTELPLGNFTVNIWIITTFT